MKRDRSKGGEQHYQRRQIGTMGISIITSIFMLKILDLIQLSESCGHKKVELAETQYIAGTLSQLLIKEAC